MFSPNYCGQQMKHSLMRLDDLRLKATLRSTEAVIAYLVPCLYKGP